MSTLKRIFPNTESLVDRFGGLGTWAAHLHALVSLLYPPDAFHELMSDLESLRPFFANRPEFLARVLRFGGGGEFSFELRHGPTIRTPLSRGPALRWANLLSMVRETWVDLLYTPNGLEIRDGQTIVDIGANIGVFTLFAATQAPHGRVFAYEPVPHMFSILRENLLHNGFGNTTIFSEGVLDRAGPGRVWLDSHNLGGHSVFPGTSDDRSHWVDANFVALSDVVERVGPHQVDLLKVDCEGSEYQIFGAADESTLARINRISMEYHSNGQELGGIEKLHSRLAATGYSVRKRQTDRMRGILWATRAP